MRQERERQDLHQKFAQDETNLLKKHKRNYQKLVEETANRATGGIIQGDDTKQYLTKQNKSASYKTRKPHFDVVKYRKNAQRLREMGRREEALQFESKAAALDEKEEISWREKVAASITSSAWGAAKSKLEQLVESQSTELTRHKREQESKLAWLEQKQVKTKTNFINTLMAERTKVIANCKAQAKKRIENDAVEAMNEQRNRKKVSSQSEGLKNISANIMTNLSKREGDEVPSSLTNSLGAVDETANTAEDNWVAPAFSGVDNSDAIVDNVGDGRDRGFVDFGSRMANELKGGISNTTTDPYEHRPGGPPPTAEEASRAPSAGASTMGVPRGDASMNSAVSASAVSTAASASKCKWCAQYGKMNAPRHDCPDEKADSAGAPAPAAAAPAAAPAAGASKCKWCAQYGKMNAPRHDCPDEKADSAGAPAPAAASAAAPAAAPAGAGKCKWCAQYGKMNAPRHDCPDDKVDSGDDRGGEAEDVRAQEERKAREEEERRVAIQKKRAAEVEKRKQEALQRKKEEEEEEARLQAEQEEREKDEEERRVALQKKRIAELQRKREEQARRQKEEEEARQAEEAEGDGEDEGESEEERRMREMQERMAEQERMQEQRMVEMQAKMAAQQQQQQQQQQQGAEVGRAARSERETHEG